MEGTYEQLLRWGAKSGSIEVCFACARGRFRVERKITPRGSGLWQAFELEENFEGGAKLLLHDDADLRAWLAEVLGLTEALTLPKHFSELVAVRQGTFTAPFLTTASARKSYFDPLFEVDAYKRSGVRARDAERELEQRAAEAELARTRAETRAEGLEQTETARAAAAEALEAERIACAALEENYARIAEAWQKQLALDKRATELETAQAEQARAQADAERRQAQAQAQCAAQTASAEQEAQRLAQMEREAEAGAAAQAERAAREQHARTLDAALMALRERLSALRAQTATIKQHREQAADGLCPFLGEPCRNVEGDLAAHFTREEEKVAREMREVTVEGQKLRAELEGVQAEAARDAAVQREAERLLEGQRVRASAAAEALRRAERQRTECEAEILRARQRQEELAQQREQVRQEAGVLLAARGAAEGAMPDEQALQQAGQAAAQARARVDGGEKELARLAELLRGQQAARAQADAHQRTLAELRDGLSVMALLRDVLAGAGERIATVLRRQLAMEAERLYARIAQEGATLVWSDGYELLLVDQQNGRERRRGFAQLSGGERMSAALAIRLALLLQFSPLRFACFDEPTDALDADRRANLAQALPDLTAQWDQVLVISHDDTFDAITENSLQLEGGREGTRLL